MRERLTFSERQLARRIARQAMIDCGGNADVAKSLLYERYEDAGVSSSAIGAAEQHGKDLVGFWSGRGIATPSEAPMPGEPTGQLMEAVH